MQKTFSDTLSLWQDEGRQVIPENHARFRGLVAQAAKHVKHRQYRMAAVYGEMAAAFASGKSCGLFSSPELEQVLVSIGENVISSRNDGTYNTQPNGIRQVLHVATSMGSIGGHSRMLWRWIQQDKERSHSLVLTRQDLKEIPELLQNAISKSGGKIHLLNRSAGNLISWAQLLRKISATADLVVLHTNSNDVIPVIAFAKKENSPPVILLDHADHLFWPGIGISDLVVSLRESGMQLARHRRGIEPERNVLLPVILEPTHRKLSRLQAKQQLGIPENSILILSIARRVKYKTIAGLSFADAHIPVLSQFPDAMLIVIGPGQQADWLPAIEQTQRRIRVLSETEHTDVFYQAADIYVDSFPFVSNTSLLEAGSYGTPLVSRYPYNSEACGILGADMPGLTGNLIRVNNLEDYTAVLANLIQNSEFRLSLGAITQKKITETHLEDHWQNFLDQTYHDAVTVSKISAAPNQKDQMSLGEPDILMPRVHDIDFTFDQLVQWNLPLMPFTARLSAWLRLLKKLGYQKNPLNLLLPEWMRMRYYSRASSS